MTVGTHMLVWAALACAAYALIANRLFYFGGRVRRRALELGTSILNDSRQTQEVKDGVERMLIVIPRTSQAWICVAIVIPALIAALRWKWSGKTPHRPAFIPPHNSRQYRDWDEFSSVAIAAILCNSPAAASLFFGQLLLVSFVISMDAIACQLIATLKQREELSLATGRAR